MALRVRSGSRRQRITAGITMCAVVVPVSVALMAGGTGSTTHVAFASGQAWLASPEQGLVTMVDGPSEQVVTIVAARSTADTEAVAQTGTSALVADSATGTVTRIDGSTLEPSSPYAFGSPGSELSVLADSTSAYVVDASARITSVVDPSTMQVVRTVAMAARPGPQQVVLDGTGRLWVVDGDGGGLRWFDPDGSTGQGAADQGDRLVDVDGRPALVAMSQSRPTVNWVDRSGETTAWSCRLETQAGDDPLLLGASSSARILAAVPKAGTMVVTDEDSAGCGVAVPVGDPNSEFGAPVQSDHYVFIPNRTNGTTYVVDLDRPDQVLTQFPLTQPNNRLQLIARDGLVFYNDLDSEKAGVLSLRDGQWIVGAALKKYNPENPSEDVVIPNATETSMAPVGAQTPEPQPSDSGQQTGQDQPVIGSPSDQASTGVPTGQTTLVPTAGTTRRPPATPISPSRTPTSSSATARTTAIPTPSPSQTSPTVSPTSSSTSSTTSSVPVPLPPTISNFSISPPTAGVEQQLTVNATVGNAQGAQWQITLTGIDCTFEFSTPMAAISLEQQQSGQLSVPVQPQNWPCLGSYTVELTITNGTDPAASAQTPLQISTNPSTTPAISAVSCTPAQPQSTDQVACTATETVVGSRGTWTWSVTDAITGSAVGDSVDQAPNIAFRPALSLGHYTVHLTVTYRGSQDSDTTDLLFSIVAPQVVGLAQEDATAALDSAGFQVTDTTAPSHQGVGIVIDGPAAGFTTTFGATTQIVVSSGPNPVTHLIDEAPAASWYSGANGVTLVQLPWNGNDGDDRGFALERTNANLENVRASPCMETHPRWVANGYIQGWISLPYAPIAGDHFKVDLGFISSFAEKGEATFKVDALLPNGVSRLITQYDTMADRIIRSFDIDLTPYVGARSLIFTVEAGADAAQDWACWVDPRIE